MSETRDGWPAFPQASTGFHGLDIAGGMTLRDWFAGRALAGLTANMERCKAIVAPNDDQQTADRKIAEQAYRHADAMLRARTPTS